MGITQSVDRDTMTGDPESVGAGRGTVIGAAFADRRRAHDAVHDLHDEGFRDTWIGITRRDDMNGSAADEYAADVAPAAIYADADDMRVESENWFMRFFGEGDESLHDALVRHGVSEADARAAGPVLAESAILTVDGGNHPELAAQIISENGGELITRGFGATGYGTPGVYGDRGIDAASAGIDEAPVSRTTTLHEDGGIGEPVSYGVGQPSDGVAYDDYGRYRAGASVDDSTRLQLRAERLRVDKSPLGPGEATTEVGTQAPVTDVPVVREEVFIERRLGSGSVDTTR